MRLPDLIADAFVPGRALATSAVAVCVDSTLPARWRETKNVVSDVERGWYRRLSTPARVGHVASAQAAVALESLGSSADAFDAMDYLAREVRRDASWPFISNLNDVGVVDATAWAVVALAADPRRAHSQLIVDACAWLAHAELTQGGWGVVAGATLRVYSTSMALRALVAGGQGSSDVVQRGARQLASLQDRASGAWAHPDSAQSVVATAVAIRGLRAVGGRTSFRGELEAGCSWLLEVAEATSGWESGNSHIGLGEDEDVAVVIDGQQRRVHYRHFARGQALCALADAGHLRNPLVLRPAYEITRACAARDWFRACGGEHESDTSWALHDVSVFLATLRRNFEASGVKSSWSQRTRVVWSTEHEPLAATVWRRHWPKVVILLCAVGLYLALVQALGLSQLWGVVSAVLLNVIANVVSVPLLANAER